MSAKLLLVAAICRLLVIVGVSVDSTDLKVLSHVELTFNHTDILSASLDFGNMISILPAAVFHPSSTSEVSKLIRLAYESPQGFTVSARGHGHSINGQAQVANGIVVQMSSRSRGKSPAPVVNEKLMYVDVWGGELWIDVLKSTLKYGLAPKSWTDYLYLSVGGTISNAGISGQAFNHGPQISNVHEVDVVTGKGEIVTCDEDKNSELFHAVLGGLGQFGIITRARIALEPSPHRVYFDSDVVGGNFNQLSLDLARC